MSVALVLYSVSILSLHCRVKIPRVDLIFVVPGN